MDSATHKRQSYFVDLAGEGRCECADNACGNICKHIYASLLYRAWIKRAARSIGHSGAFG